MRYSTDRDFKETKIEVYAWYCESMPSQFGPFEAVGLPGTVCSLIALI